LIAVLDAHDVPNVAVQLPSCLPAADLDDASLLRSVLDECVTPAVLVGHSLGGLVLTEVGAHPSVKHLLYVDAVMWDVDEAWPRLLAGGVAEGWAACAHMRADVVEFEPDAVHAYLVSRGWPTNDADEFVLGFAPQRHVAAVRELSTAAWRTVPSTYVSPRDSEMKIHLREVFASRATNVIDVAGDHFPHWRRPDEIANICAGLARAD
jgi:pimeloyl-ACP methyl ester carboxylesterase